MVIIKVEVHISSFLKTYYMEKSKFVWASNWNCKVRLESYLQLDFSVHILNIQMDISEASDIEIRSFKNPNSSTHPRLQLLCRVQGQKRSISTRKFWCKKEGEIYFLICGKPLGSKSNGIGEIFFTPSNLLVFSLHILSLGLSFCLLKIGETN